MVGSDLPFLYCRLKLRGPVPVSVLSPGGICELLLTVTAAGTYCHIIAKVSAGNVVKFEQKYLPRWETARL